MATNKMQVYLSETELPTSAYIELHKYNGEQTSKPFTTLDVNVGSSGMQVFFSGDDGTEARRIVEKLHKRLGDILAIMDGKT